VDIKCFFTEEDLMIRCWIDDSDWMMSDGGTKTLDAFCCPTFFFFFKRKEKVRKSEFSTSTSLYQKDCHNTGLVREPPIVAITNDILQTVLMTSHINNTGSNSCPLCGINVTQLSFEDHYQQELLQLSVFPSGAVFATPSSPPSPASITSSSRKRTVTLGSTAVPPLGGRGQRGGSKNGGLDVLAKIRKSRSNRASSTHPSSLGVQLVPDQPLCFLCGETLYGDSEEVNQHIDLCLAAQATTDPLQVINFPFAIYKN